MQPFKTLTSHLAVLAIDNIDTDQIIPARFLTTISKAGLGQALFTGWRHDANGRPKPDFPLHKPEAQGAQILLAGDNFGCGSSREHAPWALMDFGFRAVISTSFADIFRNNSLKNGLLPVVVDARTHARLLALHEADPRAVCTIDVASQMLTLPDGTAVQFPLDSFSKTCLLEGIDELGYLVKLDPQIAAFEKVHPPRVATGASTTVEPC
jgi:3-isopropylmalate/(R)-2-methylmalate dehydratase small subunit